MEAFPLANNDQRLDTPTGGNDQSDQQHLISSTPMDVVLEELFTPSRFKHHNPGLPFTAVPQPVYSIDDQPFQQVPETQPYPPLIQLLDPITALPSSSNIEYQQQPMLGTWVCMEAELEQISEESDQSQTTMQQNSNDNDVSSSMEQNDMDNGELNSYPNGEDLQNVNAEVLPELPKAEKRRGRGRTARRGVDTQRGQKPQETFRQMIGMALESKGTNKATLTEIYNFIAEKYDCYRRGSYSGWKNSIRHNLSMGNYFQKLPKDPHGKAGKGHYWTFGKDYQEIRDRQKIVSTNHGKALISGDQSFIDPPPVGNEEKKPPILKKKKHKKPMMKEEEEEEEQDVGEEIRPPHQQEPFVSAHDHHHHHADPGITTTSDYHHPFPAADPYNFAFSPQNASSSSSVCLPWPWPLDDHNALKVVEPAIALFWWNNNNNNIHEQQQLMAEWTPADMNNYNAELEQDQEQLEKMGMDMTMSNGDQHPTSAFQPHHHHHHHHFPSMDQHPSTVFLPYPPYLLYSIPTVSEDPEVFSANNAIC